MRVVKLSEVAAVNPSKNVDPVAALKKVSFVPMASVSETTCSIISEEERPFEEVSKGYTSFQKGDILLAKITPCFENGKIAIANISNNLGFGSTEFHVLRPNTLKLHTRY